MSAARPRPAVASGTRKRSRNPSRPSRGLVWTHVPVDAARSSPAPFVIATAAWSSRTEPSTAYSASEAPRTGARSSESPLLERLIADGSLDRHRGGRPGRARSGRRRAAARGRGGGAAPRADSLRLLSLRVDLRDAPRRGAAAARPQLAALEEGLTLKDATPYNVQFRGSRAGLHRRRLVRAPARGRALGRLPAVLHALPLSAAPAGLPRRCLPALAARLDRRHHARGEAARLLGPARPPPPRRPHPRRPARSARAPLRGARRRRGQGGAEEGQLQAGADRRQRAAAAQARRRARAGRRATPPGPATASRTPTATRTRGARPTSSARPPPAAEAGAGLGHGLQRRRLLADRRRAAPPTSSRSTPTTRPSRRSTARCAPRTSAASCRWSATSPIPRPGWGGAGWSAARSRQRGTPDLTLALAARPPRLDHRQRPRRRVPRLAAGARLGAGDRVPQARGPDGAAASLRQARGLQRRLRARDLRAPSWRSASRSERSQPLPSGTRGPLPRATLSRGEREPDR